MPNRLIKSSIHESEKVNQMTDFQFRLWVNLITYVDDYGRGDARPAVIKGNCFPLRERLTVKDIEAALNALAGIGCVSLYEVDGKPYLCFPNWESHQSIRNKKSRFPAPDSACRQLRTIESNCDQLQANAPVIQSNPNPNPNTNGAREARRFSPPTVDEVRAYCRERGNTVDPQRFVDHYTANGWKVGGKSAMKDWRAAVRNWEGNAFQSRDGPAKPDYQRRAYTDTDFREMEIDLDA